MSTRRNWSDRPAKANFQEGSFWREANPRYISANNGVSDGAARWNIAGKKYFER
jgi:hypothetical protein